MITRAAIRRLMRAGLIKVDPAPENIGPNSIDLRLGDTLKTYAPFTSHGRYKSPNLHNRMGVTDPLSGETYYAIDPKNPPPLVEVPKLPDGRWLLVPGQFYLGVTKEKTYCRGVVPHLDGRSTCGRLSIEAHKTAGVGDNGFEGRWTLEIEATEPVLIGPGDRLFQVYFTPAWGEGVALLIEGLFKNYLVTFGNGKVTTMNGDEPMVVEPFIELHDLYGKEGEAHYQCSDNVRGPSPLD